MVRSTAANGVRGVELCCISDKICLGFTVIELLAIALLDSMTARKAPEPRSNAAKAFETTRRMCCYCMEYVTRCLSRPAELECLSVEVRGDVKSKGVLRAK